MPAVQGSEPDGAADAGRHRRGRRTGAEERLARHDRPHADGHGTRELREREHREHVQPPRREAAEEVAEAVREARAEGEDDREQGRS